MSNRNLAPAVDALTTWRKTVDAEIDELQQRQQGAPNGLMGAGGVAGTWAALPLNAAVWTAGGGAYFAPAYALDADGFVHLRGLAQTIAAASPGLPSTIGTLPVGYRPGANVGFATWSGNNAGSRAASVGLIGASGVISLESVGALAGSGYFIDLGGAAPFYVGG